jgi:branched-chain amino acid transport system ATP-binding protein
VTQDATYMAPLLAVDGLQTFYGSSHVLFGVGLEVRQSEVVVLLGRNGAGKTTTLKSIMGLLAFRAGSVRLRGTEIGGLPADAICRRGLGYVPEDCRIFRGLTVAENLEVARRPAARRDGAVEWTLARLFGLFPMLEEALSRRADSLSGGQQRMLAIARTLMGNPDLLLLDEPSEGLAPLVVRQLLDQLAALKSAGATVLLSEQNLKFALELADRAYIIEKGEIKYDGSIDNLRRDADLRRKYLMV